MKIMKKRFATDGGSLIPGAITILSAAVIGMLGISTANACDMAQQPTPIAMVQPMRDPAIPQEFATPASLTRESSNAASAKSAALVGMWSFQLVSLGNTTRTPSIADGAQLNFGYTQFHSDGTEILNAGARSPAQQNMCLGVWQQIDNSTYLVNHFTLNYNAAGTLIGRIILKETLTVSAGGTILSGTFDQTVYDTTGNRTDHLTGQVSGQRITIDTATP